MINFVSGSGGIRDLPSFPTRRSSDLSSSGGSAAQDCPSSCVRKAPLVVVIIPEVLVAKQISVINLSGKRIVVQDRKSTRLNSSHPSISYAVFCLKKKIA